MPKLEALCGVWRQGLTQLHLRLVPNTAEVPAEVLRPLRGLRRLQTLVVENRSLAQPTLHGLEALGAELRMLCSLHIMGCVVGPASGLAACTSLRSLRLSNCILMLVRVAFLLGLPALRTSGSMGDHR